MANGTTGSRGEGSVRGFGLTVFPRCSQNTGTDPRSSTYAAHALARGVVMCSSCSVSTKLAAPPASLSPRVLKRVPACSEERREMSVEVRTPPPGTVIRSVIMAACNGTPPRHRHGERQW